MAGERRRTRTVIGRVSTSCPECGGGPMLLAETRVSRRVVDLVNPRFDADVRYQETCEACGMRFGIARSGSRPSLPGPAPTVQVPLFSSSEPASPAPTSHPHDAVATADVTPIRRVQPVRPTSGQAALFTDDEDDGAARS